MVFFLKNNKKVLSFVTVVSIITILIVGFFHEFEVDYSDYRRIKRVDGEEGFYPDGYIVFHTEKEYIQSACFFHLGKDISQVIDLDFSKYSYVIVQGAKIKRMYYSIKSTLFDDKSPYWASARRHGKLCLFIEYQTPDKNIYIYQIEKNTLLTGFGGA